jgi:DNA-directed RNA polymerase subunit RPC12/RpoP
MELTLHNVIKLASRGKMEDVLTGKCSKCNYLFTMSCKDLGIVDKDTIIVCPDCGHRERLQSE